MTVHAILRGFLRCWNSDSVFEVEKRKIYIWCMISFAALLAIERSTRLAIASYEETTLLRVDTIVGEGVDLDLLHSK